MFKDFTGHAKIEQKASDLSERCPSTTHNDDMQRCIRWAQMSACRRAEARISIAEQPRRPDGLSLGP